MRYNSIEVIYLKYYSIGKFAKEICKTPQTLRNWDKEGILKPAYVTEGGTRYYSHEQLHHFLGIQTNAPIHKKIVGYCRVSSSKQKDDLERQIEQVNVYVSERLSIRNCDRHW